MKLARVNQDNHRMLNLSNPYYVEIGVWFQSIYSLQRWDNSCQGR